MRFLIPLFVLVSGCAATQTAYRAPVSDEARDCARDCIEQSQTSGHADTCLSQCPGGFQSYPGDACTRGEEQPGTLCVTVTTALAPDMAFWGGVAEAAAKSAVESATKKDDDNDDSKKKDGSGAKRSSNREREVRALAAASRQRRD